MLLSNLKKKEIRGGLSEVLLVPELCYATGQYGKKQIEAVNINVLFLFISLQV